MKPEQVVVRVYGVRVKRGYGVTADVPVCGSIEVVLKAKRAYAVDKRGADTFGWRTQWWDLKADGTLPNELHPDEVSAWMAFIEQKEAENARLREEIADNASLMAQALASLQKFSQEVA